MLALSAGGKLLSNRERKTLAIVRERITLILNKAFTPSFLEVVDESDQHKGHGGWREGGETHFRVRIVSPAFSGRSRIEIHRAINEALKDEIAAGIHALAIEAKPG
jgi:BolA protein